MSNSKINNLDNLRHSCAHLLAAAVQELWPDSKRTIGPSIENGFYFDFDFGDQKVGEEDLPKIEERMLQIVKKWDDFSGREVAVDEAKAVYKDNPYKIELIEEFSSEGQKLTFYKSGDYEDLCRGGHVDNPKETLKHFKLTHLAGAYWRGEEKNKMLTRIYGTVWPTKEELEHYIWQQEEAKKRDHKKLGRDLELFMFHETAPGMPYWLPKGVVLYNKLVEFWRIEHAKRGYQEIVSPVINKKELSQTSGHWDHYREDLYVAEGGIDNNKEQYVLKPMNCPNAMIVFGFKNRSYKDFPLRLSDTDILHRYELSGTLNGLLRAREFRQDDAHIFLSEDFIENEFNELFEITDQFYSVFGLEFRYRLGTRPKDFMGEVSFWDKAEKTLKKVLDKSGKDYFVLEGDGAFYGPKIDILMKDALGREWQMGTLQLDLQIPQRFDLKYTDKDGSLKTPIVIHRVVYGSLERFIGLITEHYAGAFPVWIAPIQVVVLPISEKHADYAETVLAQLKKEDIRATIDARSESLGSRIRNTELQKIPYMLVVGDKEVEEIGVTVRDRHQGNRKDGNKPVGLQEFIDQVKSEIATKANN